MPMPAKPVAAGIGTDGQLRSLVSKAAGTATVHAATIGPVFQSMKASLVPLVLDASRSSKVTSVAVLEATWPCSCTLSGAVVPAQTAGHQLAKAKGGLAAIEKAVVGLRDWMAAQGKLAIVHGGGRPARPVTTGAAGCARACHVMDVGLKIDKESGRRILAGDNRELAGPLPTSRVALVELREMLQTSISNRRAIQRELGEDTILPGGWEAGKAHRIRIQLERNLLARVLKALG